MFEKETLERKVSIGISVLLGFLIVGAVFFHTVEKWSYLDSVYFSVVTLSTIGYGDLVPHQEITKLFIIFYIIFGVSAVLYVFTTIGSYYLEKHEKFMQKTMVGMKARRERLQHTTRRMNEAQITLRKNIVGRVKKGRIKIKKMRNKSKPHIRMTK